MILALRIALPALIFSIHGSKTDFIQELACKAKQEPHESRACPCENPIQN